MTGVLTTGVPLALRMPQPVLLAYSELLRTYAGRKSWRNMSEQELWQELCLCILSSNVPYEMAISAFHCLYRRGLLNRLRMGETNFVQRLSDELGKPICLPRRKDGSLRRYRFPNVRARQLVGAGKHLYFEKEGLHRILASLSTGVAAREYLSEHVPGVGLKEASNFLRNIKHSNSVAIVDSHIVSFLREMSLLPATFNGVITPRAYVALEKILQALCDVLRLDLSVLDLAIWQWMRGRRVL